MRRDKAFKKLPRGARVGTRDAATNHGPAFGRFTDAEMLSSSVERAAPKTIETVKGGARKGEAYAVKPHYVQANPWYGRRLYDVGPGNSMGKTCPIRVSLIRWAK